MMYPNMPPAPQRMVRDSSWYLSARKASQSSLLVIHPSIPRCVRLGKLWHSQAKGQQGTPTHSSRTVNDEGSDGRDHVLEASCQTCNCGIWSVPKSHRLQQRAHLKKLLSELKGVVLHLVPLQLFRPNFHLSG